MDIKIMTSDLEVVVDLEDVENSLGRKFDSKSPVWSPEPTYNLALLRAQLQYANDLLEHRGVVLLNEVYERLGFSRTTAGALLGWTRGEDCFISFGSWRVEDNDAIVLDFNVEGIVFHKLSEFAFND